ncbi:hypothetical protein NV379_17590 [Paenibacillus sp. N1-5-1-14]|uniref:hypothetical protein n=1 Tax=Paenibacillus radicibacter TaxID=2972488 RepID=UPI0021594596|nr:hypothetical protein [Paenibacillus radicibacter]MCR8644471.1 hypothetical protein [Paenibacillus radicibacter]
MKIRTENQFVQYVAKRYEAKYGKRLDMTSRTFLKDVGSSIEDQANLLYEIAMELKYPISREYLITFLEKGNFILSDYYYELNRLLHTKQRTLKIKLYYMIVLLMVILVVYYLFEVNILLVVVCSSIGSGLYAYIAVLRQQNAV